MKFFKKAAALITAAAIAVTAFAVSAFAAGTTPTFSQFTKVSAGKTTTDTLKADSIASYWIQSSGNGELKVSFSMASNFVMLMIMDKDGNTLKPHDISTTKGQGVSVDLDEGYSYAIVNDKENNCAGKASFTVAKGNYLIMFSNMNNNPQYGQAGKLSFKPTFSSVKSEISRFTVTLSKGSTLQLGTLLTASTTDTVKWSTSKKAVASVTTKGKVKAVSAGTAVITATLGSSKLQITIKVV